MYWQSAALISCRYEDRLNSENHLLFDWSLNKNLNFANLFFMINNIANKTYSDVIGIPMPGRNIVFGVNFKINK